MPRTLPRCFSDSMLFSEWADDVISAFESGKRNLQAIPGCMPDDTAGPDPLENAKMHLKTLKYNQRGAGEEASKLICAGSVEGQYKDRVVLHRGSNSTIVQAREKASGKSVILKVYGKCMLNDELMAKVEWEKAALERSRHRNVVNLLHVLTDDKSCILVFENCLLGDMVRQVALQDARLSEVTVFSIIIKQVLLGLQHMHEQGIIHCGVSPTSVLMRDDKSVCLCDLSHSFDTRDEHQHRRCHKRGHLDYLPPEVILADTEVGDEKLKTHECRHLVLTPAVDVWQVGCLAFELLAGRAPFEFSTTEHTATAIVYGRITEWPTCFRSKSISFIKSCLQKVPERRATIGELLQHPVIGPRTGLALWFTAVNAVSATKTIYSLPFSSKKANRD